VAPIVVLNANSRQVYLPAGNWVNFWTGAVHAGSQTITWTSANRMQFPLFVREGAIVPLLPEDVQTLCDATYVNNTAMAAASQDLTFLIYPASGVSQFSVYDETKIECQRSGSARVVTLNSIPRAVTLQVFGDEPPEVSRNGSSLPKRTKLAEFEASDTGWRYDAATRFAFIKFPHAGGSAQIRC